MTQSTITNLFSSFDKNKNTKNGLPPEAYLNNEFFEMESKNVSINAKKGNFDVPQLLLSGLGAKIILSLLY